MRRLLALVSLAGCDVVLGLDENPTADSVLESANHDGDGDDIGDGCDPRPMTPDTRHFIAFEDGDAGTLVPRGSIVREADALVVGSISGDGGLLLDIVTDTAHIEADMEIVETKVLVGEYAEVGLHTVRRSADRTERGDTCYWGTDTIVRTPPEPPNYLEFNHDADYRGDLEVRFDGTIVGVRGRFSHDRTPDRIGCAFASETQNQSNEGALPDSRSALTGNVAVTTVDLRARFHYLWIVTPRP